MCIAIDNSFKVKMNYKQEGIGYKVMEKRNGKYYSDNVATQKCRPKKKWLKSKKETYWMGDSADFGWHLFPRLVDANKYYNGRWHNSETIIVMVKVKFRGLISQGNWEFDINMRNIVVKYMFIVEEIKHKTLKD